MKMSPFSKVILIVVLTFLAPAVSHALSASQVTLNFMCACGTCDEALSTCECPQSNDYRAMVSNMVGQGYSEEQIIQDFVGRWGSSVLVVNAAAAPRSIASRISSRTLGFVLILFGVTFAAFLFGKYYRTSSTPVAAGTSKQTRKKSRSSVQKTVTKGQPGKSTRFQDGVDDHLLDDYIED
jgi:cytochrome c-type biogenesis protein CcmH/NrfF